MLSTSKALLEVEDTGSNLPFMHLLRICAGEWRNGGCEVHTISLGRARLAHPNWGPPQRAGEPLSKDDAIPPGPIDLGVLSGRPSPSKRSAVAMKA